MRADPSGHSLEIPITKTFLSLLSSILSIKTDLIAVLRGAELPTIREEEWNLCESLHSVFSLLQSSSSSIETMDTVIPNILQTLAMIHKVRL